MGLLGLQSAVRQLDRIKEHFLGGQANADSVRSMLIDLHNRMLEAFEGRLFLALTPDEERLYSQPEPLWGVSVDEAFPSAAEDVAEMGRCFAVGRYTAAVFHMMRVLEVGLSALSAAVGAQPGNPNWETIINSIQGRVNGMSVATHGVSWKEDQRFYSEAVADFRTFKHAWRNYVTHSRVSYTEESARRILGGVRDFMQHLAGRLHGQQVPII